MMVRCPALVCILLTLFTGTEWRVVGAATREYILSKEIHDSGVPFDLEGKRMERVPLIDYDRTLEFPLHSNESKSWFQFPTDSRQNETTTFDGNAKFPNKQGSPSVLNLSTAERDSSDERSVQIVQNWWSFYPFHWMLKLKDWDTANIKLTTEKSASKEDLIEKETTTQGPVMSPHISDKIKRLLNLFSIVKFDNIECNTNGTVGVCLHRFECESRNGKFSTTCAQQLGVCCHVEASNERTCGGYSKEALMYFVSQGIPVSSATAPKICTLTLDKIDSDVSQLRLEFIQFQLREPTNGTCFNDRLVITGQNIENVVPELCGFNSGQHIYVDVDDSVGPYTVNVVFGGEYSQRNFKIRIIQLKKGDEKLAPKHCLQFYTTVTGVIESFNYRKNIYGKSDETNTGYFNNLNYAICIRKVPGYCSISYENVEAGNVMKPTFQMVNTNEVGDVLLQPRQAGAETFDCPNDYIIIAGMRLCGEKLNDGSINGDFTKNYPITDTSNGPFLILVRTDQSETGRGFSLTYQQNSCSL